MSDSIFKEGIYIVTWARAAKNDLERLVRYISEQLAAPRTAFGIEDAIHDAARGLSYMPQRFPLVLDERKVPIGEYRCCRVKNYEILFVIDESSPKKVKVRRIFHGKQNWRSNLQAATSRY